MPWDALPSHIDESIEWKNTDWDWWGQRWLIKIKGWFAYGPRSKKKWAAWKSPPRCILGFGVYRFENLRSSDLYLPTRKISTYATTTVLREDGYFPSFIQYWSRAHFLLQWPFHLSFHVFFPWAKPPKFPEHKDFTIKEMISIRFGARYDKDDVYWFPSGAVGGDFT